MMPPDEQSAARSIAARSSMVRARAYCSMQPGWLVHIAFGS
jgi:hypothetical protein